MMKKEPKIKVALLQNYGETRLNLKGNFSLPDGQQFEGILLVQAQRGLVVLIDSCGVELIEGEKLVLTAEGPSAFTVYDVKIGINFHWQRNQEQMFRGDIILSAVSNTAFNLVNEISLEDYLASVISSEMSADAPLEFLKAQAITARSWLVAMLAKKKSARSVPSSTMENEIIAWQDVNDHEGFDVCADDHCQRYQGITRIISENVRAAIDATRGLFLVNDGEICDARYYKSCGGRTEIFSSAWEDQSPSYLQSIPDGEHLHPSIQTEREATDWLSRRPPAYCNTTDKELLGKILPAFDQETPNFYRWQVIYTRQELEDILRRKSGIDFGDLQHITPLERGPSGRIYKLKIEGSKRSVVVGKELEIRRWLSESHLLSSAFVVAAEHETDGSVKRFIFHGGGWGHGVGLCQIGAAVMASEGFKADQILAHYFTGASLQKLY